MNTLMKGWRRALGAAAIAATAVGISLAGATAASAATVNPVYPPGLCAANHACFYLGGIKTSPHIDLPAAQVRIITPVRGDFSRPARSVVNNSLHAIRLYSAPGQRGFIGCVPAKSILKTIGPHGKLIGASSYAILPSPRC